jgi:hypothetical protein
MLAHVGRDYGFASRKAMEFADNCLRFNLILRSVESQWLRSLPLSDPRPPRLSILNRLLCVLFVEQRDELI